MWRTLLHLFEECLETPYLHRENGASYAVRRERRAEGDGLYLFFEKSNGTEDWINNLDFFAEPYRQMSPKWYCHGGFLRVFQSVKPYLQTEILDPAVKQITVVGYSHGAALALLCHEWIYFHRPDLRESLFGVGYGCPRVLCAPLPPELPARWDRFFVVRNQADIVTHLPPRILGYTHVGNLITLNSEPSLGGVEDHKPERYLRSLRHLEELPTKKTEK